MNRTLNMVLWVVLFILILPSSLAVASWNSLPGSNLFSVKLFMEQALVFVVPTAQAKGTLEIAYTKRRFSEANRLLSDQSSVQGLSYLNSQIDTTKQAILATNDPVVKKQLAQKYIATLQTVNMQLEQTKQLAQANSPAGTAAQPTATPTPRPTPTPYNPTTVGRPVATQQPATPTPTPTEEPTPTPSGPPPSGPPPDVVGGINDTQNNINQTIGEMEGLSVPGNNNGNHGVNNGGDQWNGSNNGGQGNGYGNGYNFGNGFGGNGDHGNGNGH